MIKVLIFHYSDFAMWLHIEVTEQGNCETTVPESDILAKKKHRGMSVSFKTVQEFVDFDFLLPFLFETAAEQTLSHDSNISEKQTALEIPLWPLRNITCFAQI